MLNYVLLGKGTVSERCCIERAAQQLWPRHLQNALPLFTHAAFSVSLHFNLHFLLNIFIQMQPEAILCVCVSVKWVTMQRMVAWSRSDR